MLENRKAEYTAIYWVSNGGKVYDIWQKKEVEDKDKIEITGIIEFESDDYKSNYSQKLIDKIRELQNNNGFTHITVFEKGRLKDCYRISKVEKIKTWDQVIEQIKNNYSFA